MTALGNGLHLALLGGFHLSHLGGPVALSLGARRLLALLALHDDVHRATAAEQLWPDSSTARAAANLRSALWRGRRVGCVPVIDCVGPRLRLAPAACVDVREIREQVQRTIERERPPDSHDVDSLLDGLGRDLLPGWSEDWLVLERERWNQIRLHALETMAHRLMAAGHYLPAMQTALAAIAIEPLRETPHRTVMEIHVAEGNRASAIMKYRSYRVLLQRELGVAPSSKMIALARDLLPG